MTFLPENYEQPKSDSNYMKFEKGENKFRILSKPILGWEDWKDKKPLRFPMDKKPQASIDPKQPVKHFWTMLVWNYEEARVQILEITQVTVIAGITTLVKDLEWGAPYGYDIKVIKKGDGMETEYTVTPSPKKKLADEIVVAYNQKPCNLNAIMTGEDPFADWQDEKITPMEDIL